MNCSLIRTPAIHRHYSCTSHFVHLSLCITHNKTYSTLNPPIYFHSVSVLLYTSTFLARADGCYYWSGGWCKEIGAAACTKDYTQAPKCMSSVTSLWISLYRVDSAAYNRTNEYMGLATHPWTPSFRELNPTRMSTPHSNHTPSLSLMERSPGVLAPRQRYCKQPLQLGCYIQHTLLSDNANTL